MRRPLVLLAVAGVFGACTRAPVIVERPITVHALKACPVDQNSAYSVMYASGDFEPSTDTPPFASLPLAETGTVLGDLPATTRSIEVVVSEQLPAVDWHGLANVASSGPVDVLVWPDAETCRLNTDVERRTNMTFGVFGRNVIVAGGTLIDGAQVPHTYVGDLATGILEALDVGPRARRAGASITAFQATPDQDPAPALFAGGQDPDTKAVLNDAEIYVPKPGAPGDIGDFDRTAIELSIPRMAHGAVVLANGSTLLVGGVGAASTTLRSMEIVDPVTRTSRTDGVALLQVARVNPTVLRLATGEILVAGGLTAQEADGGVPVPTLEWFSPDATHTSKRAIDLVTGSARAFVPLEAGGAIAVIKPGTLTPDFKTVWVISSDGSLSPAEPIDPAELDAVRLFEGNSGAPLLWTGRRWLRWQPWAGLFAPFPGAPGNGATSDAITNGDPGLALWLDDRGAAGLNVTGFRFATKSRYDAVPRPLLANAPDGLAPDRLAGPDGSSVHFDAQNGLELGPGASAFVTDVTLADFVADLDVIGAPPEVVLRQENGRELEIGGAACAIAQSAQQKLHVERSATVVRVSTDGGALRTCPVTLDEGARVSVGLRGSSGFEVSAARNLVIVRH